jgi:hypothetical protein
MLIKRNKQQMGHAHDGGRLQTLQINPHITENISKRQLVVTKVSVNFDYGF